MKRPSLPPRKPRTPLPSRTTPLARSGIKRSGKPIKRSPVKRKRRKPSEFSRIYGSRARVAWIKSKPCAAGALWGFLACADGPSHNAHTVTGGMGRKANADTIVPLCSFHHAEYDQHRGIFALASYRAAMIGAAAAYELAWSTRSE